MRATLKKTLIQKAGAIFVFVLTALAPAFLSAQPHIAWIQWYNGPGNLVDQTYRMAIDGNGNVYVTGKSDGSGTGSDIVTLKYGPSGNLLWERRYNGPGNANDYALFMELDSTSNVYVAGTSVGVGTSSDYTIIKHDSNGNQLWVTRYNISSVGDGMTDFTVDALGNSYISGFSNIGGLRNYDGVVAKFNPQGNYLWSVLRDAGPGSWDVVEKIAIASDGSLYLSGGNLFGTPFLEKLSHWSIPTSTTYKQLAIDGKQNVYAANIFGDYITRKYDSGGSLLWSRFYNGSANGAEWVREMIIDTGANIYVIGGSPGVGTGYDFASVKYDSAGNELWVARFNGIKSKDDVANAGTFDENGNIYVTGSSDGSWAYPNNNYGDYATVKYDSSGNQIWSQYYNGSGDSTDQAADIAVDDEGNIYVTGTSFGNGTNFDIATIKYSPTPILKGDLDESGVLALDDIVSLLNWVFLGTGSCSPAFADVNCDAFLTPADVVVLLRSFFLSATPPC